MSTIFDIQQSITAANGNISLAKDLFSMLLADLDTRVNQIESSFENNDMEMLAEHVHKLYGATAYCIVPDLRKSTGVLEDVLRAKEYSELEKLVQHVLNDIKQLMNSGASYLEKDWEQNQ